MHELQAPSPTDDHECRPVIAATSTLLAYKLFLPRRLEFHHRRFLIGGMSSDWDGLDKIIDRMKIVDNCVTFMLVLVDFFLAGTRNSGLRGSASFAMLLTQPKCQVENTSL